MQIQLLAVPYDSGHRGVRMGAGPEALLRDGLADSLRRDGHVVHTKIAELPEGAWTAEIGTAFELMRMLSGAVRDAVDADRFPIVLAGNCNTAVGTLAGLGDAAGVAWFDAHADFNTPETTSSGFLDGTAVATITGRCWTQLAGTVPSFQPVPEHAVCLIGVRDIDPLEAALLEQSNVSVVHPGDLRAGLRGALSRVAEHVDRIYVHLDLDVLDAGVARANSYAVDGGLSLEDVRYALKEIGDAFTIAGVALTAYDPAADSDGAAASAAIALLGTAAGIADRT